MLVEKLTKISGSLTVKDWQERRQVLTNGATEEIWSDTFADFFKKRLELRYLTPIDRIEEGKTFEGEGFTIVTIQCALIEFLAAARVGKNFTTKKRGIGVHEYKHSEQIFSDFLSKNAPFNTWFSNKYKPSDFYKSVRCGLVHEARTKGGWKILATSSSKGGNGGCVADHKGIDPINKVVNRISLQESIVKYIDAYGASLTKDPDLQAAFIRKYDHLIS